jgi:hypothetical protein
MTDKDDAETREARLKKALRDNLKRRKAASRRAPAETSKPPSGESAD